METKQNKNEVITFREKAVKIAKFCNGQYQHLIGRTEIYTDIHKYAALTLAIVIFKFQEPGIKLKIVKRGKASFILVDYTSDLCFNYCKN